MTLHLRVPFALTVFFFLLPFSAFAATLSFSPATITTNVGGTIQETIFVSSPDQAMNAISGTLSFPTDLVEVTSVSKANSVLSLWVQDPTFSNADGVISFSGIVPNPGYIGSRGQVFSISFRAKKAGTASVVFRPSLSQVLANDGNGTNILTGTYAATITIAASASTPTPTPPVLTGVGLLARITSSTHPDQTKWYKLPHAIFDWTNAQGVSAVRLGYDEDPKGTPSVLYTDPISHKELDLADGVWYFRVQERGPSGWGPVSTYKVQVDTVAPSPFTLTFPNGATTESDSAVAVQFTALDELSGIDHYRFIIDGKETRVTADEGSRPYAVSAKVGTHTLVVRAYDKAGNVTSAEGKFSVTGSAAPSSEFFSIGWLAVNYLTLILIALAILGTLLFAVWYIRIHFSAYRHQLHHRVGTTHIRIHKEFDRLKDAITDEVLRLEQAKSARTLTREEERLIARFKKLIDQSEQEIAKEVEELQK